MATPTFESVTALKDKYYAFHQNEGTVEYELYWLFDNIVHGGSEDMFTVQGINDFLFEAERGKFGNQPEIIEASKIAYKLIFGK